jgi:anti-sigma factor RsiW
MNSTKWTKRIGKSRRTATTHLSDKNKLGPLLTTCHLFFLTCNDHVHSQKERKIITQMERDAQAEMIRNIQKAADKSISKTLADTRTPQAIAMARRMQARAEAAKQKVTLACNKTATLSTQRIVSNAKTARAIASNQPTKTSKKTTAAKTKRVPSESSTSDW